MLKVFPLCGNSCINISIILLLLLVKVARYSYSIIHYSLQVALQLSVTANLSLSVLFKEYFCTCVSVCGQYEMWTNTRTFEFVHKRVCVQRSTCECVHIRVREHVCVRVQVLLPYKDI